MKYNWKICTIKDLGTVVGGATPSTKKKENYDGGTIAWITPKDLSNFSGRFISRGERNITEQGLKNCSTQLMPAHTVLFSSRAPIGYIAIATQEVCTNQGFKSVIPNENTDYMFLYYLLKYNKNKIEHLGSGTTFKEVSGNTMRNVEVEIPESIEEQKKIASVLSALDDKIELNNAINKNLEQQAQAIFQSWFVDFDPFGGVCPTDWKNGILSDIANITSGKRPPMKSSEKTDVAVVPLAGASSVMGYTTEANYFSKILVIGRVGTHGIVQRFSSPCWASDNTLVITTDLYEYTYQILQRINYHAINRGSTQPLITQSDMNKIPIPIPDKKILTDFETVVGQLMKKHEANKLENDKLAELRDSLLPRLMSGELDVSALDF